MVKKNPKLLKEWGFVLSLWELPNQNLYHDI